MTTAEAHLPPSPPRDPVASGTTPRARLSLTGPLLFTAFEPSGDEHASTVIAELRRRHPDLTIYGWGGPKMEKAGAIIVEATGHDAVMGVPGLQKILEHSRINARIEAWILEQAKRGTPVALHVPVDSPAANGPICEIAQRHSVRVVHLVAPQIWAWGRWRIHKLRRLTNLLLCLLPFEEDFFAKRRVPAKYIGHMLFDKPLDLAALDARAATFHAGTFHAGTQSPGPRIAIMPGSRPDELRRHLPVLLDTFLALKADRPGMLGVVAATNEAVATLLRRMGEEHLGSWPDALEIVVRDTDAVIRWCDMALVKSGTVTLQVARQLKPMVVFYRKSNPFLFLIARLVLSTKVFSLPNVLARRRIVPELIPYFGGPGRLVAEARKLLDDPAQRETQRHDVQAVLDRFAGIHASARAADAIEEFLAR